MDLRPFLTRRNIILGTSLLAVALVLAGFFAFRRPPRVAMERYVPADALGFVQIDSVADLVDGLTNTKAWRDLAPVLGLSSQLRRVGLVSSLIGRSGLGPDEAVVAGRAQCAIVITGIDSDAGESSEGAYLHLRPQFALLIETHTTTGTAEKLVRERTRILAQRIYGESSVERLEDYRGSQLRVFEGPGTGRQLVAASHQTVIIISNQSKAVHSCLDAMTGRAATLASDQLLQKTKQDLAPDPSVFAYVTAAGIEKLVDLWPLLIAGRETEPESIGVFTDLIEHLSKQAGAGLFYSMQFVEELVTEKYLTSLRAEIAGALSPPFKPAPEAAFESLPLIPQNIESVTFLKVENAGELPERVLKQLSPEVDLVAGVALREFVINLKKQYGLQPGDAVGDAIGNEIALVNFGDDQPRMMLIRINDRVRLAPMVSKYLNRNKATQIKVENHNETEIQTASDEEGRAAAFVGDFLILGTRDQIVDAIETSSRRDGLDRDDRLKQALSKRPSNSSILYHRTRVDDVAELLLAISRVTRVTDGSLELLDGEPARKALDGLERSTSFTEFRDDGIYTQVRSAVGNLTLLSAILGTGESEQAADR